MVLIFVMPGLVPGIHVFLLLHVKDVDGRDIRAFTPVFDGAMPGHDVNYSQRTRYREPTVRGVISLRMILPPFITNLTRCNSVMSASGSPDTAIRSANLPFSIDPTRSSSPNTSALLTVAAWMAAAAVICACLTNATISRACV